MCQNMAIKLFSLDLHRGRARRNNIFRNNVRYARCPNFTYITTFQDYYIEVDK